MSRCLIYLAVVVVYIFPLFKFTSATEEHCRNCGWCRQFQHAGHRRESCRNGRRLERFESIDSVRAN